MKFVLIGVAVIGAILFILYQMGLLMNMSSQVSSTTGPQIIGDHVYKYTLKNGLTILVKPITTMPKVTIELWYNVGSKDEQIGEKGIAHLIEHMIFKGTEKLSESDIDAIIHKFSGSCNAFTSYDYTGYVFNLPSQSYKEAFPIMADCMQNCKFDDQMLNSEMKAVIQELKMNKDNYARDLITKMLSSIFPDHPYHYPVIGYKEDLWSVASKDLKQFYKKHYVPNAASLVVVGDVVPQEVFELAEKHFSAINADDSYQKQRFLSMPDIASKTVTLYRSIQQPFLVYAFTIPGISEKRAYEEDIALWIFGRGKGSRLYKKLVNELKYVTSLDAGSWDLFDYSMGYIFCEPVDGISPEDIKKIIVQELESIAQSGIRTDELDRAINKAQSSFYSLLESTEDLADHLGQFFLATGDEHYLFECMNLEKNELKKRVELLFKEYIRPSVLHYGAVLPIPTSELPVWTHLQELSDQVDKDILSARVRTIPVQDPVAALTFEAHDPQSFNYPKAQETVLSNGLKLLYYNNNAIPKITILLRFKAQYYYDPDDKIGLSNFVSSMMTEGTQNFSADELADFCESKGMTLQVYPGCILLTLLRKDLGIAFDILQEIVTKATFPPSEIEKVRQQLLADIKSYWDEPRSLINQLVKDAIYKGHPYSKNMLGTKESVAAITRNDLIDCYHKYISPMSANMAIVGDLSDYDVVTLAKEKLKNWTGPVVPECDFPSLSKIDTQEVNYTIDRDQVTLMFACPSIDRKNPDYDALLIFDQIFGAGMLHSMSNRLFQLREESGLFYMINGTFLSGSEEQPGIFQVKTIVSLDRLQEAEEAIFNTIKNSVYSITDDELIEAKRAIANASMDNFSSNTCIARSFLYLDRFNLPKNYFDDRLAVIKNITKENIIQAVERILKDMRLLKVRVGRV